MSENHILQIKTEIFDLIEQGIKTLDVRVGFAQIKKIKLNDTIEYYRPNSKEEKIKFDVVRIAVYTTIEEMLEFENHGKILPKRTRIQVLNNLKKVYTEEKLKLGIYVFEIKKHIVLKRDSKLLTASSVLRKNKIAFSDFVNKVYTLTDSLRKIYPDYTNWYFSKVIPGIIAGNREIIICTIDKNVAGVLILKNTPSEKKICTLYVTEKFQNLGVGEKLLKKAFSILGTNTPLFSVSESKFEEFKNLIFKLGWSRTQTLPVGFYNENYEEFVYNGNIQ